MLTFEAELLLGVLGAGLPGAGEGLDRVDLGSACGGLGVTLAGGVDADVVVLGAGVGFGLPCPAGLRAGVLAGLSGFGERGVPLAAGGVPVTAVERRSGFRCRGLLAALGMPMWRVLACVRVSVHRRRHRADVVGG